MRTKRSLGQNFFVNENLGNRIVSYLENPQVDTLLEIGPGTGFFTAKLENKYRNIYVVEKDKNIATKLTEQFPNIEVFNEDFLDFNINSLPSQDIIFFGSLPFNISKKIIKKIIESKSFRHTSYFIIQKEVAEKYIYKKPYSTLSLLTRIYAECNKLLDISPESFRPKPNVYSSLISFTPSFLELDNTINLKNLISLSFKYPRKNLLNNLKGTRFEEQCKKYRDMRPSDLSLNEYLEILNREPF